GRLALIGWVFLALGLGGGVYLGAATLFRVNELESLFAALKRRFARRR
ncbi:MAG: hypothetical protein JNJ59_10075, partial [Deltaproteobacteria bacterium]|nr:hypothetical protein [Deltaproteobacteria bacterium]